MQPDFDAMSTLQYLRWIRDTRPDQWQNLIESFRRTEELYHGQVSTRRPVRRRDVSASR